MSIRTRLEALNCGGWRLTLLGRSTLLIASELVVNAVCWIAAGLLFGRHSDSQGFLSLAVLAWTIGLRHGLDADHISAIDNATRGLLNLGQLPVTCGLFFSLGHSTIVIAVNVAIAISTDIYDKFANVTDIGGIIGSAVSASFLFIIGLANSIILYGVIKDLRKRRALAATRVDNEDGLQADPNIDIIGTENPHLGKSIMMRILGPVTTFVNRPWKMYPVGVLFGLGFDTASSIALLAVSALAKKDTHGNGIPQGYIVLFPFMFTAGMTLVDSTDSILMLYSYAGFPERKWAFFERTDNSYFRSDMIISPQLDDEPEGVSYSHSGLANKPPLRLNSIQDVEVVPASLNLEQSSLIHDIAKATDDTRRRLSIKQNTMSGLCVVLTLISILVAFSISLITFMGLIESVCKSCQEAEDAEDGGGLAGSWWRAWSNANDQSGYIGAAIVGCLLVVVIAWYGGRALILYVRRKNSARNAA